MKVRRIAPRLASGDPRDRLYNGLPPEVKKGLKLAAARENISVSWMLEQIIIDHFGLRRPLYLKPKTTLRAVPDRRHG